MPATWRTAGEAAYIRQASLDKLQVDTAISDAAFVGAVDAATLFQQQAKKAGIEISVNREAADGYWDNVWLKRPLCAAYWGGYPTESEMFALGYAPGAAWNDTYWTDGKFERLRHAASAELDDKRRRQMYADMQMILNQNGGAIIPCFAHFIMARSSAVGHGPLSSNNSFDGARATERWWAT